MSTLYIRNVPDEVGERLARQAAREGLSVSAFVLRELTEASRRADAPALLAGLPDLAVAADDVVADLRAGRAGR
jgi:plasmid stability protein